MKAWLVTVQVRDQRGIAGPTIHPRVVAGGTPGIAAHRAWKDAREVVAPLRGKRKPARVTFTVEVHA